MTKIQELENERDEIERRGILWMSPEAIKRVAEIETELSELVRQANENQATG